MNCKNCKNDFLIAPEDLAFYDRITVPPPTWCPECRLQRRLAFRNGWHLFKRKESRTGQEIFSFFPPESFAVVYDRDFWWSDGWDPLEYGVDYDFSRPFFEQFGDLMRRVPLPSTSAFNLVNCRFCMNLADAKNCYLVRGATYTEDSAYIYWDTASRQCMDSHMTTRCELGYGNVNCENCYQTSFSVDCDDCQDTILSKDCVGCSNCFGCIGLRSKSYCIFNEQYSKEAYREKLQALNLGSYVGLEKARKEAYAFWKTKPHKFMHGIRNINVSGDYLYESKNARECYRGHGIEDSKYTQNILKGSVKDCYDFTNFGENAELCYEVLICGRGASNIKFTNTVYINAKNIEYSMYCYSSSDLFGCMSLGKKQYCILNKQYSKEEYFAIREKIISHMRTTGEYGEYFPPSLSFFPYHITEAYEFFPMTESEAKERGFLWYDIAHAEYAPTLQARELPDNIKDATDDIVNQTIGCEHEAKCNQECTGAFRIIPEELTFLRRMHIPLPRLCPNCRHYERLTLRNPPHFYDRQCMKCGRAIQTSYAPDSPEVIYCEQCYHAEIL